MERRSFLRGMRQGGAVAREFTSGNQVRVGQCGATSRTCSSLGETHTCVKPEASCVPVRLCRGGPLSGKKQLAVGGLVGSKQVHLSFPESTPNQPDRLGMESPLSGGRKLS